MIRCQKKAEPKSARQPGHFCLVGREQLRSDAVAWHAGVHVGNEAGRVTVPQAGPMVALTLAQAILAGTRTIWNMHSRVGPTVGRYTVLTAHCGQVPTMPSAPACREVGNWDSCLGVANNIHANHIQPSIRYINTRIVPHAQHDLTAQSSGLLRACDALPLSSTPPTYRCSTLHRLGGPAVAAVCRLRHSSTRCSLARLRSRASSLLRLRKVVPPSCAVAVFLC